MQDMQQQQEKFVITLLLTIFVNFYLHLPSNNVSCELYGEVEVEKALQQLNSGGEGGQQEECDKFGNCAKKKVAGCLDRLRTIGLEDADKFVLIEASVGQDIQLDCHYCSEADDLAPKAWFRSDRFFSSAGLEIEQRLGLPAEERKFNVDPNSHRLTIRNFTQAEGGIYYCTDPNGGSVPKFNFVVDVVSSRRTGAQPQVGAEADFVNYYQTKIQPINAKLAKKYKKELESWIQLDQQLFFMISYEWGAWKRCNICGKAKGVKRRFGKCRLSVPNTGQDEEGKPTTGFRNTKFGIEFSCHSLILHKFLEQRLVDEISRINDFIQEEECFDPCPYHLESMKLAGDDADFKRPVVQIERAVIGQKVTLMCPKKEEDDYRLNDIIWLKNDVFITESPCRSTTIERHSNLLILEDVCTEDSGLYSCSYGEELLVRKIFELRVVETDDEDANNLFRKFSGKGLIYYCIYMVTILCLYCCGVGLITHMNNMRVKDKGYQRVPSSPNSGRSQVDTSETDASTV